MDRRSGKSIIKSLNYPSIKKYNSIENLENIKTIKKENKSLLIEVLRRLGNKERAIFYLKTRMYTINWTYRGEIVATYIYFKDYEGALNWLRKNPYKNIYFQKLELYLYIHLKLKGEYISYHDDIGQEIEEKLISFLKNTFDREIFILLLELYDHKCNKKVMCYLRTRKALNFILEESYLEKMNYSDLEFINKIFRSDKIIEKMVEGNILADTKYIIKYCEKKKNTKFLLRAMEHNENHSLKRLAYLLDLTKDDVHRKQERRKNNPVSIDYQKLKREDYMYLKNKERIKYVKLPKEFKAYEGL
ncbi:hypothetical protein TCON_1469 [Astathelohania contejeani]|uniref:Uncharacterized protein n=1 Tax=Astathelohania contejeani TaxID=164912 RepID=A0ABQ7HYS3_9MICR|nr:hypothetical protein TCON_1469 [Thelohania contejeani]